MTWLPSMATCSQYFVRHDTDAHLAVAVMADEKLTKLREATAGLTQIRSAALFRSQITYFWPHERDRNSFFSGLYLPDALSW